MKTNFTFPRILIISAQPYNESEQSRTLDSYFHNIPNDFLAQIFSDERIPQKGNCSRLFQITDKSLIKRRFYRKASVGRIFLRDDLATKALKQSTILSKGPRKKTYIYRLLRKVIWNKKLWDTPELENFVSDFKPDAIFVTSSPHFYTFEIALHFSKKFDLPILFSITDDYYFVSSHVSAFGKIYLRKYRSLIDEVMKRKCRGFFLTEAAKEMYCSYFKIPGDIVYLASDEIPLFGNEKIDISKPFFYFGNGAYGRMDAIFDFAEAMQEAGLRNELHIYGNWFTKEKSVRNLRFFKGVPHSEMLKIMNSAGALVYIESLKDKYADLVKFSMSTKSADYLCSGKPIIVYGNRSAGAISFMIANKCAPVAVNHGQLVDLFKRVQSDSINPEQYQMNSFLTAKKCFDVDIQSNHFLESVMSFI